MRASGAIGFLLIMLGLGVLAGLRTQQNNLSFDGLQAEETQHQRASSLFGGIAVVGGVLLMGIGAANVSHRSDH